MRIIEDRIHLLFAVWMIVSGIAIIFVVRRDLRDRAQFHRQAMEGPSESVRGPAFRFARGYCGADSWAYLGVSRADTVYTYTWSCGSRAFECVLDRAEQQEGCRLVVPAR